MFLFIYFCWCFPPSKQIKGQRQPRRRDCSPPHCRGLLRLLPSPASATYDIFRASASPPRPPSPLWRAVPAAAATSVRPAPPPTPVRPFTRTPCSLPEGASKQGAGGVCTGRCQNCKKEGRDLSHLSLERCLEPPTLPPLVPKKAWGRGAPPVRTCMTTGTTLRGITSSRWGSPSPRLASTSSAPAAARTPPPPRFLGFSERA